LKETIIVAGQRSFFPAFTNSSYCQTYRRPDLLCHSNNQLSVKHLVIVVVDISHWFISQDRFNQSKSKTQNTTLSVVFQLFYDFRRQASAVYQDGSSTVNIIFASASSITTTSINIPRSVVTIAGQS
jgi:hypothetical protein